MVGAEVTSVKRFSGDPAVPQLGGGVAWRATLRWGRNSCEGRATAPDLNRTRQRRATVLGASGRSAGRCDARILARPVGPRVPFSSSTGRFDNWPSRAASNPATIPSATAVLSPAAVSSPVAVPADDRRYRRFDRISG